MSTLMSRELRRDFWVLTLGQFLLFCGYFTFFQFPLFIQSLGGGEAQIGLMMGVQTVAATLVMPWVAPQLGRYNLKRTMAGGTLMVIVATAAALTLTAANAWMATIMIVRGLGFSLFMNASGTYIARIVPVKERSRWLGISFGFNQIAIAIGPAAAEAAIEMGGFRW
ncbi:MAG TPA: MFS transporter, partial [bacterium]